MTITSNISTITVGIQTDIGSPMFLNQSEVDDIRTKKDQSGTIWNTAWNKLLSTDIATAMSYSDSSFPHGFPNVVDAGIAPSSGDKHVFYSRHPGSGEDANYTEGDYRIAINAGKYIRALGLGYALTGNSAYAEKCIKFIRAWCLDPATYMKANDLRYDNGQAIFMYVTIPGIFYGIDLIWNYSGFSSYRDSIKNWATTFHNQNLVKNRCSELTCSGGKCQNYENWRQVTMATASVIAQDSVGLNNTFEHFKQVIPHQIGTDGKMLCEYMRKDWTGTVGSGLAYSTFALNTMIQIAEIAKNHNTNLYGYKDSRGVGLEKALDFHVQYLSDPNCPQKWNNAGYPQTGCDISNAAIYEVAKLRYSSKVSSYMTVINGAKMGGRPMYEIRVMGPVTLTHGV